MKDYCTVLDVLAVARVYLQDVDVTWPYAVSTFREVTNTIAKEEIEVFITEASEMVRGKLRPRYDTDIIDAYDPDYPPVVIYLTKSYTAKMCLTRFAPASADRDKVLIDKINEYIDEYEQIIISGSLFDGLGVQIVTVVNPTLFSGAANTDFTADGKMKALYEEAGEDGRIY